MESAQSESDAEIVKAIFSGVSYKIISSDEQDETAVVKAKISNKDVSSILSDTMADAFSEILSSAFSGGEMSDTEQNEMMNKLFMEKLSDLHNQLETAKVEVLKPFPREEELQTKLARLEELNALLNMDKREPEVVAETEAPDNSQQSPTRKTTELER